MFGILAQKFIEATEREKYLPPILLTTMIINIVANVILIPRLGAIGAALATLLSEAVLSPLVQMLYGDDYSYSVQSLSILLPNIAVFIFEELGQSILAATGQEKRLPRILLGAVIANVATNAILIPILGGVGGAIATIFSEVVLVLIALRVIIDIGYKRVGNTIRFIVGISLLIAGIPSLMLYGLTPIIGLGLMVASIAGLILLLKRDRFCELKK